MKKILFSIPLAIVSLFLTAQNQITFNALGPVGQKYELSYERSIKDRLSIEVDLAMIHANETIDFHRYNNEENSQGAFEFVSFSGDKTRTNVNHSLMVGKERKGFSIEIGPAFNLFKIERKAFAKHFYIKPEVLISRYTFPQYRTYYSERVSLDETASPVFGTAYVNESSTITTFEEERILNLGGKANVGLQNVIANVLVVDVYFFAGYQQNNLSRNDAINYAGNDAMYERDSFEGQTLFGPRFEKDDFIYGNILLGFGAKIGFNF